MGVINNSPKTQLKTLRDQFGGVKASIVSQKKTQVGTPVFAIGGNGPIYGRKLANKQVLVLRYTPDNKGGYGEHFEVAFTVFFLGRGRKQNPPLSGPQRQALSQLAGRLTAMCPDSRRWGQFRQLIPPSVHAIAGFFSLGTLKLTPPKSSLAPSYGLALAGMLQSAVPTTRLWREEGPPHDAKRQK